MSYYNNNQNQHSERRQQENWPNKQPPVLCQEIPSASFRSAAEAHLDSSSKYRQLPCKTLISIGTCPYGERCVFLHDPRLICHMSHSISRLKNKEDNVVDSFFWPLTANEQSAPSRKNDHNFRPYSVPAPKNDQYKLHDQSLYSLWMHYVEFCRMTAKAQKSFNAPKMAPQDMPINIFTQRKRLPVFQLLSSSQGHAITKDQFHFASFDRMRSMSGDASSQLPPPVMQQQQLVEQQKLQIRMATPPPKMPTHKTSPTSINNRLSFGSDNGSMRVAAQTAMKMTQQQQYGHEQQQHQMMPPHHRQQQQQFAQQSAFKKSPLRNPSRNVARASPSLQQQQHSDNLSCSSGFTSFCSASSGISQTNSIDSNDFSFLRHVEVNGADDCDSELSGDEGRPASTRCM